MSLLDLEITIHASGPVPVATAWERYDRLDLWPTWSPQLSSVSTDLEDDESQTHLRLAAGLTGRVHGPAGLWAQYAVLSVDEAAMTWSWQVRRGPVAVHLDHAVESAAEGSLTSLTLRGPAPLVLGYVPVAWYALHRLVSLPPE